ncbi:TRAP transporter large permease [Desulfosediminicola flagellatus]|uniref:TRAP transporter large permease n=1 Tax=Desulfosediminicola flagellatus TaxID=2569541 RepID=UPI0010AD4435|nr:TRAP transporter large permease [Desulfosediminicola flagellatus]
MGWILFLSLFALILTGMPIALAIGFSSLIILSMNDLNLVLLPQRMFVGTDSFPMIAIPFFILAGDLLAKGNVSKRLVDFADACIGWIRGGLALVAVLGSMFFAAISGSSAATTAAIGTPLIPEMKKKGYDVPFAAALIAASGTIGVIIPPSVPMILYAIIADVSVAQLFLNGFLPGVLMGGILMIYSVYVAKKKNYPIGGKFSLKNIFNHFKIAFFGLLTPIIILGGIFSGFFTPSESAVIAVDYAIFVALFVYRDINLKQLYSVIINSGITMAMIMFLIATSKIFSWVLANWSIPSEIANAVLSITENPLLILLLINVVILIAGIFMETASALIILTPVFLPVVEQLGINLVHFGIVIVMGLAIGMITPPVAINLYVASSITGESLERLSKQILPMLLLLISVLLMTTFVPLLFY